MKRSDFRWLVLISVTVISVVIAALLGILPTHRRVPAVDSEIHLESSQADTSWPQLMGPTFDGHSQEEDLADSWPEDGPPILWTRELGQGYSGCIAVGDRVYTQTQSLYRQSLVCLSARTGEEIWAHHYGWPYDGGGLYPGPRSSPTWYNGRIYFAAPDGTIGCVSADHGTPIWSCNPKKTFRGRGTDFGYASSPVIIDGRLILPIGGAEAAVVALDPESGAVLWTSGQSSASYATPLPIRWHGRSLVVIPLENSVATFDVATGKQEWEVEFSNGYDEHSAAPIYQEPYLVIASPFRAGAKQYELTEDSAVPGQLDQPRVRWETPKFSNDVASSVLVDGRMYGFDLKDPQSRLNRPSKGEFRCLDFATGRVIWSTNKVGQANIIVVDGKLIMFSDNGELILAQPGTDEYTELARTQVFQDEICWTYPALHRGCVYLRTQSRVACVYLGRSAISDKQPVTTVREVPRYRVIDAKWLIGGEREFPATTPEWSEFRDWYLWSLVGVACASLTSLLVVLVTRAPRLTGRGVFWFTVCVVGLLGSPVLNAWQTEYVLLWPLVLWTTYQWTINTITWAESTSERRGHRWMSRGCGLLFLATCLMYFHLCRSLGYAIEWSFLIGFLPSFPIAVIAAKYLVGEKRWWILTDLMASTMSFSGYFWFSVIFIKWRLAVGS